MSDSNLLYLLAALVVLGHIISWLYAARYRTAAYQAEEKIKERLLSLRMDTQDTEDRLQIAMGAINHVSRDVTKVSEDLISLRDLYLDVAHTHYGLANASFVDLTRKVEVLDLHVQDLKYLNGSKLGHILESVEAIRGERSQRGRGVRVLNIQVMMRGYGGWKLLQCLSTVPAYQVVSLHPDILVNVLSESFVHPDEHRLVELYSELDNQQIDLVTAAVAGKIAMSLDELGWPAVEPLPVYNEPHIELEEGSEGDEYDA